ASVVILDQDLALEVGLLLDLRREVDDIRLALRLILGLERLVSADRDQIEVVGVLPERVAVVGAAVRAPGHRDDVVQINIAELDLDEHVDLPLPSGLQASCTASST